MGQNKKVRMKAAIAVAFSSILISTFAYAQTIVQQETTTKGDQTALNPLVTLSADPATLLANNCDPSVLYKLNNDYVNQRTLARSMELQTLVREQVNTTPQVAPGGSGSCFQQAVKNINSVVDSYNSIVALLSGTLNPGPLIQKAGEMVMNAACQQIDTLTGSVTGGISGSINQATGGTIGSLTGAANQFTIGSGANSLNGTQILNGVGVTGVNSNGLANGNNANGAIPYITNGTITNGIGSAVNTLGGTVSSSNCTSLLNCQPFK